ncbi:purine-binding chemotaxis protein CheW [Sphaerotilus hippei]|uniref:Chemotaxis protein CheW n=1 Tax=Sphaerotilus hippei TaxID=744406 RepID=A0A318H4D6_9BURK|nr:chemotaxis protein CheW [Sphaerotilus hippei]PXW98011.1 purine-binding chemotaxis protein CheW [Sphaerotilus hippei]
MSDHSTDTVGDAADDELAGQDNQFVTFALAGEMFAVPMGPVQEIIRVPVVAQLPLAPDTLDGLANLRGRVLPLINLRRLFGCEARDNDDATRAVVINLGQPLGFVVDRVASVVSVEPGQIEPASSISSVVAADFITGVIRQDQDRNDQRLLLVLDFARLIEQEFSQVAQRGDSRRLEMGEVHGTADGADDDEDHAGSEELRLVSFAVAEQEYAVDIAHVHEIVQLPERITALPNTAGHVLGVISLRQRLLPLVSLRSMFGLPVLHAQEQHRIVVIALPGGSQVGLVTDSVKEVLSVPRALAEPMPALLARDSALQEFAGICRLEDGKRLVSIIDTRQLLGMSEVRDALEQARDRDLTLSEDDDMNTSRSNGERESSRDDDDTQVVIFRLGAEEFGVPIMSVQEIVRVPETLTRVPRTPRFVEGVINLRGTVLPVIDQRTRLGMAGIERNDRQRIMVYLLNGVRTGFIVDSVAEVLRIPRQQIDPAPDLSVEQGRLISQVAKLDHDQRLVMLIDPDHLLQSREVQSIQGWTQGGDTSEAETGTGRAEPGLRQAA